MLKKTFWLWPVPVSLLLFSAALALCASGFNAQETKQAASETKPAEAQFPEAHFHHLHLNTLDPKGAIDFYTSKFDCEKAKFAGMLDAVWAQKSWLLFTKVEKAPPWELTSAIWHFGWGAEDMKATYEKHVAAGTKFFTPLTDISDISGKRRRDRAFLLRLRRKPRQSSDRDQHGRPSSLRPSAPLQRRSGGGRRMVCEIFRRQTPRDSRAVARASFLSRTTRSALPRH